MRISIVGSHRCETILCKLDPRILELMSSDGSVFPYFKTRWRGWKWGDSLEEVTIDVQISGAVLNAGYIIAGARPSVPLF